MIWSIKGLVSHASSCQTEINGRWVPARPVDCRSIWTRLKEAWYVFTGKVEAFKWPEGQ